jgi:alkylation response protein AidB-like acyl-CoA dehydrogenase
VSFDFPDEIKELQLELRRFLQKTCTSACVRATIEGDSGKARELTAQLATHGWLGAGIPGIYGGQGLGPLAACAVAEELGRALAPGSCGSSLFLVAEAILLAGSAAQKKAWVPALVSGARTGALAVCEKPGAWSARNIAATFRRGKLSGTKQAVVDGLDADLALVAARTSRGVQLLLVDLNHKSVRRSARESMDPSRPVASIRFRDTPASLLGGGAGWSVLETLLDRAAVVFAFEQLGVAEAALEMARQYALQRVAFGRVIGSFQAIKHKLADVYIANELARRNAHFAAAVVARGGRDLATAAATARVAACEALERAARENLQVHGGVGVTWTNDCHLYYRRARHLATCIGTLPQWRDRLAGLVIAARMSNRHQAVAVADESAEAAAYRARVRAWLKTNFRDYRWPPGADAAERLRLCRGWMTRKTAGGFTGIALPINLGGQGGTPLQEVIFCEEEHKVIMGSYDESFGGNLVGMAVPTMLAHAQPGWAEKLVSPTIRGDILWCQMFSEPDAGSDLAGIRTRAIRSGDEWIVNGQKIWTSGAQNADWGLLLTRTDVTQPKHQGLTYFLLDMKSPGVEVRPLKQISGRSDFNEVFFTDVKIPDSQRMGEVNGGWQVAMTTMMNERLSLMVDPSTSRDVLAPLIRLAARTAGPDGSPLTGDNDFRDRIASYHVVIAGMTHVRGHIRTVLGRGHTPGPEATIGKVTMAKWTQEMAIYGMDMTGTMSQVIDVAGDPDLAALQEAYFLTVGYRIGGGTEEIAKNIISERLLGLPQESRPDKAVPFNEVAALANARRR